MSHDFIENALTRLRDDSELVALRADKVRLTAEVSCLEAVIRAHERVDCLLVTSLKKQLVEVDAEVVRLNSLIANSEQENARLKAEVERLTFDPLTYLDDHGEWMPRHTHLAAVERLNAQVERLTSEVQDWEPIENAKSGHHIGFCRTEQGLEIIGPITVIGDEVNFQSGIGNKPTHFQRYPNPPKS